MAINWSTSFLWVSALTYIVIFSVIINNTTRVENPSTDVQKEIDKEMVVVRGASAVALVFNLLVIIFLVYKQFGGQAKELYALRKQLPPPPGGQSAFRFYD